MTGTKRVPEAGQAPQPSELEWEILKPLWERGPLPARDVYQAVSGEFDWAYETVKTMLARLVKKGLIAYDQVGNSYLYRAVYSRPELSRVATKSFVKRVFDGALNPLMAYFAEEVSEADLKLLKAELRRVERQKREDADHGDGD